VHGLEAEYAGEVRFVYLDIDDPDTMPFKRELGYRVQPHLFLLDGAGNVVDQWLGRVTADDLRPALDAISG
jgi:thioredoxin-like negative regulator of GroEL